MLMPSVISLYAADYIYTPWLDSSTFLPGTFSPSSNINQQAWFPETRNSLSKRKPRNTCTSKKPARTWVKNQAIRLRHSLIVYWKLNLWTCCWYSWSAQHQQLLTCVIDVHRYICIHHQNKSMTLKENCCIFSTNIARSRSEWVKLQTEKSSCGRWLQSICTAVTWLHILDCSATHMCPRSPQTWAAFFPARVDWLAINGDTLLEWERSPQNYQVNRLGSQGQQNPSCLHTIR